MALGATLRRWRRPLIAAGAIALLVVASVFVTLPLRETDKAEAARTLVAWIVEGRPVPGFGEEYPDAAHMPQRKRFFVVCDFVPADAALSGDPRVQRIAARDFKAVFGKHQFDETDYMTIELKAETSSELVVEFSNVFGGLAGHGYRFEFRRTLRGLRASGKFLWVS